VLPSSVPTEIVDTGPWVQVAATMGGAGLSGRLTLTRGTAAACWAIAHEKDHVVLVGFDNVKTGINAPIEQSFHPDYWESYTQRILFNKPESEGKKHYPIGGSKTATHDMAVEGPLLRKLAKDKGVVLSYAEDLWP
jgi:hypothetical protein